MAKGRSKGNPLRHDLRLYQSLVEDRVVSVKAAAKFIWTNRSSCNRRLSQNEKDGYIRRWHVPDVGTFIRLTRAGLRLLLERGFISEALYDAMAKRKSIQDVTTGFLLHEAQVAEMALAVTEACRKHASGRIRVIETRTGPSAEKQIGQDGRVLRPDRVLVIKVPETERPQQFFLERDRNTRSIEAANGSDVCTQLRRYEEYADHGAKSPFRVVFLTNSTAHISNIVDKLGGSRRGLRAYAVWDEFLADPLGRVLMPETSLGERRSLIEEWPEWPTY